EAHRAARSATSAARQVATRPALDERAAADTGVVLDDLVAAWDDLSLPLAIERPADLRAAATRLQRAAPVVLAATEAVRATAASELQAREDRWSPLAERLARWLGAGRASAGAEPQVKA